MCFHLHRMRLKHTANESKKWETCVCVCVCVCVCACVTHVQFLVVALSVVLALGLSLKLVLQLLQLTLHLLLRTLRCLSLLPLVLQLGLQFPHLLSEVTTQLLSRLFLGR